MYIYIHILFEVFQLFPKYLWICELIQGFSVPRQRLNTCFLPRAIDVAMMRQQPSKVGKAEIGPWGKGSQENAEKGCSNFKCVK